MNVIPFAKPAIKHYCLFCEREGIKRLLTLRNVADGNRIWHCRGCGWMGEG